MIARQSGNRTPISGHRHNLSRRPDPHDRMTVHARRRKDLARAVRDAPLDALLVAKPCNVSYLTGFTGDSSFCLVTPKRIDPHQRRPLSYSDRVRVSRPGNAHSRTRQEHLSGNRRSRDEARSQGCRYRGIRRDARRVRDPRQRVQESRISSADRGFVEKLRAIKDETEIAAIRNAIRIAEQGYSALAQRFALGQRKGSRPTCWTATSAGLVATGWRSRQSSASAIARRCRT